MTLTHKSRIIWISLFVAWCFDFLFWKQTPGITFLIFVILCLGAGFAIAAFEKIRPAPQSLFLIPLILYFAGMTAFRREPLTEALNFLATLTCLTVFVSTFRGGRWLLYSLSDYVVKIFQLAFGSVAKGATLIFGRSPSTTPADNVLPQAEPIKKKSSTGWAVVRGILLALPVLLILAALLASADPVFSRLLGNLLYIFNLDRLSEYIFRGIYILVGAFLLCGVYVYAMTSSNDEKLLGLEKPWLAPFLGWTESTIVLGSIDALFAVFVAIQFRYFFGGRANINLEGFTFAEYARRGFSELVWVAVISLLVLLILSTVTRREENNRKAIFTWLGGGLVVLVAIILVSAFQRLMLYEDAYGFSRIRIYTHVFMIWLGVLLIGVLILDVLRRQRTFALMAVVVAVGFVMTLNFLNVDGFITQMNVSRTAEGFELDVPYLVSLSTDSVPDEAALFTSPNIPDTLRDELGTALACQAALSPSDSAQKSWRSFNASVWQAQNVMDSLKTRLETYPATINSDGRMMVTTGGKTIFCLGGPTVSD